MILLIIHIKKKMEFRHAGIHFEKVFLKGLCENIPVSINLMLEKNNANDAADGSDIGLSDTNIPLYCD